MLQRFLTWTCHACGRERFDHEIAVLSDDLSEAYELPAGTMRMNVRYCRDNVVCRAKAAAQIAIAKKVGRPVPPNPNDEPGDQA